jgi:hypothetical protein
MVSVVTRDGVNYRSIQTTIRFIIYEFSRRAHQLPQYSFQTKYAIDSVETLHQVADS